MTATQNRKTLEQRINEAQNRLSRLRAQGRSKDTRQKIIVGALAISDALDDPSRAARLLDLIGAKVIREADKKDLAPLLDRLRKASETIHG